MFAVSKLQVEPLMRFQTEMQHHIPDLRSAPIRETSSPYSPLSVQSRAASLEPQAKEHLIPVQRLNFSKNNSTIMRYSKAQAFLLNYTLLKIYLL